MPTGTAESIYRISAGGRVEALQVQEGQELWRFYQDKLPCEAFTIVRKHSVPGAGTGTNFDLLLVGDEEAVLRGSAVNARVTNALAATGYGDFYGDALLVCVHAAGDDGDDENLADVGLIYEAMSGTLPTPWTAEDIAALRKEPLQERVLELLDLFGLE
jgi:hypothetical protein